MYLNRYESYHIEFRHPKYRTESQLLTPISFDNESYKRETVIDNSSKSFEKKQGIVYVSLSTNNKSKRLDDKGSVNYYQTYLKILPIKNRGRVDMVSPVKLKLEPGNYWIRGNYPSYQKSLFTMIEVKDSLEQLLSTGRSFIDKSIILSKKPMYMAIPMSLILPGAGEYYFDYPFRASFTRSTIYTTMMLYTYYSYEQYDKFRDEFILAQEHYSLAESESDIIYYQELANSNYSSMENAKKQFVCAFSSAVLTNVINTVWLYLKNRHK